MRIPATDRRGSATANMTPMIDVVFLLIIFFLVSSHLARQENHLPLDLPTASTYDLTAPSKAALTISLDNEAKTRIAGDVVDPTQLRRALRRWVGREGTSAAIRIRTDGQIQYAFVEPVLREAALAGITDAAIAVQEESRR